jgi:hypothetical protein
MRLKELAGELGACTACSVRVAQGAVKGKPGHTILGDSWFASVKVTAHPPTNAIPTCAVTTFLGFWQYLLMLTFCMCRQL